MKKFGWLLLAIVIIGAGFKVVQPRGIRNNNPGNIRWSPANDWLGQTGQDDAGYAIFEDPKFGIRAMGKILDSYHRGGHVTLRQIIFRWAPPGDNNPTEAYLANVMEQTGWPDYFVPVRQEGDYLPLVRAIIQHENGRNPYSDEFISQALAMA